MSVLVIDYGLGNLASVRRALEECGADVWISEHPDDVEKAAHLVLPGVGAFTDGMQALAARGWPAALYKAAVDEGIPLLGICLGMQLLADFGEEGGGIAGLGLIPGRVVRLRPRDSRERIPHVGWNEVRPCGSPPLFAGIDAGTDFYFTHAYHFVPAVADDVAAYTPYCGQIVSALRRGNIWGVQFHPEKSSRHGLRLLRNFLALGRGGHA